MIIPLAISASLDVTYEVDELRHGDITRPNAVTRVAGGKALNVARSAAALGAEVQAIVALGGPIGDWVRAMLADDGVSATVIPLRRVTRTCTAVVESAESTTSTDLYEPATALDVDEWDAYAAAVRTLVGEAVALGPAPWVALSGSVPPGVPLQQLGALLGELRARGAHVVVDGSGDGLRATAPTAELIKVNRGEASELMETDFGSAADACRALRERFGADAVVTDGVAGSAALIGEVEAAVPAPRVRGRFPAGSGDSFLGGLLAAFERGEDARSALAAASDAGVRNALVPGQGRLAPAS